MIRMLKSTKGSAVKARTQTINQMKSLVVTAPAELRETLGGLAAAALAARCKGLRPGPLGDPTAAAKYTSLERSNPGRAQATGCWSLTLEELHSLISRDFGQWSWPPVRCREKEKRAGLGPARMPSSIPPRVPTLWPPAPCRRRPRDAHARRIRADRGRDPAHRHGARVRRPRGRRERVQQFPIRSCGLPPYPVSRDQP